MEIGSALARLLRMKQITGDDYVKSRTSADLLAGSWFVIQPSEVVRGKALRLLDRHDLRAGDAFQLASALEWCGDTPSGKVFITADHRLREAALLSGFTAPTL